MIENVKIIVVENDPMIRQFMVDVLEFSVNREVIAFENGTDALRHLKTGNHADMIICSKDMHDMSGLELLGSAKKKTGPV